MRSFKVMLLILICTVCLTPIENGSVSAKTTFGKFTIQNGVGFLFSIQKVVGCKEDPDMSFGVNTIRGIRYYTLFPLCRFAEYAVKPDVTTLKAKFDDANRLGDQGFPRQGYYYAFQAYSTKKYYLLHLEQIQKLPGSFEEKWRLTFTWEEITPSTSVTRVDFPDNQYFTTNNSITGFSGGETGYIYRPEPNLIDADFTARVSAKWDGGAKDYGFGMIFRQTGDGNSFYIFQIAAIGYYELGKMSNGKWQYPVGWQKTDLIKPDFNELKVICRGGSIICYLNGIQVINIQDTPPDENQLNIGIGVNGGVKCSFKDFMVGGN